MADPDRRPDIKTSKPDFSDPLALAALTSPPVQKAKISEPTWDNLFGTQEKIDAAWQKAQTEPGMWTPETLYYLSKFNSGARAQARTELPETVLNTVAALGGVGAAAAGKGLPTKMGIPTISAVERYLGKDLLQQKAAQAPTAKALLDRNSLESINSRIKQLKNALPESMNYMTGEEAYFMPNYLRGGEPSKTTYKYKSPYKDLVPLKNESLPQPLKSALDRYGFTKDEIAALVKPGSIVKIPEDIVRAGKEQELKVLDELIPRNSPIGEGNPGRALAHTKALTDTYKELAAAVLNSPNALFEISNLQNSDNPIRQQLGRELQRIYAIRAEAEGKVGLMKKNIIPGNRSKIENVPSFKNFLSNLTSQQKINTEDLRKMTPEERQDLLNHITGHVSGNAGIPTGQPVIGAPPGWIPPKREGTTAAVQNIIDSYVKSIPPEIKASRDPQVVSDWIKDNIIPSLEIVKSSYQGNSPSEKFIKETMDYFLNITSPKSIEKHVDALNIEDWLNKGGK